jgi:SpoVK/Ycf46/Vps4 family AAA+-type ATPase
MAEQSLNYQNEISRLVRLGLQNKHEDFRMYASRLVRRYRLKDPKLSGELNSILREETAVNAGSAFDEKSVLRRLKPGVSVMPCQAIEVEEPLLNDPVRRRIDDLLSERRNASVLTGNGLSPVSAAIFTGPPGVGKTMTAMWIADQLKMPIFRLDLADLIGSHLGETGGNLKAAFRQIRERPGILFLDEIDAVAKTRSDDSDIGEMKRLVTVLLQELDFRDASSLILAATNNVELIDPAVWRRFEMRIDFPMPDCRQIALALGRDFKKADADVVLSSQWIGLLSLLLEGKSFSEVRTDTASIRKKSILEKRPLQDAILEFARRTMSELPHKQRIDVAVSLTECSGLSQREIAEITGVTRQTIRNRTSKHAGGGTS